MFHKEDPLDKTNYRPISILLSVSKTFEIILFNEFSVFQINFFRLCSDDSGKWQKWQRCLDPSDGIVRTLLMDLPKAYDCIHHDVIIAKLEA